MSITRQILKRTFTSTLREDFYENLLFEISNGSTLLNALENTKDIHTDFGKKKNSMSIIFNDFIDGLKNGNLDDAVIAWLPPEEAAIFATGAHNGTLSTALKNMIHLANVKTLLMRDVTTNIYKVIGSILLMCSMIYSVATLLVPKVAQFNAFNHQSMSGAMSALNDISIILNQYYFFILIFIVGIVGLVWYSIANWTSPIRTHFFDKLPPYSFYKSIQGATFLINLAALQRGSQTLAALETLLNYSSPWLAEKISDTIEQIKNGFNLGEALHETGNNFPSKKAIIHLRILSRGDNAEVIMDKLASRWIEITTKQIKRASNALSAFFLILTVIIIMLVMIAIAQTSINLLN